MKSNLAVVAIGVGIQLTGLFTGQAWLTCVGSVVLLTASL